MQLNSLKRKNPNTKSQQVGRGGKRGKTSGKGGKGQTARAGAKMRPELRDLIKTLPKLRGRGKNIFQTIQTAQIPVNLDQLEKAFKAGDTVSPSSLAKAGIVPLYKGRKPAVKVLGRGELTKKLIFKSCRISAGARVKIEKAGGVAK